MILYHICSKARLEEKRRYAADNEGKLFLTPHPPERDASMRIIPAYLHCLPNIVGAIPFADKKEATILKIEPGPCAKVLRYEGPQSEIDFSSFGTGFDALHTVYNNTKFFQWQEILLASHENVLRWTCDPEILRRDFHEQLERLAKGEITNEDFFYRDFTSEEQMDFARLVGHHVGLEPVADAKALKEKFNLAYRRIETK